MRLRSAAIALSVTVFALAWLRFTSASPDRIEGILPTNPPTPYVQFMPESEAVATALVVHGLHSNKEYMQPLSMAFADAGFETYAIDLPGHGDSRGAFTYAAGLEAVEQTLVRISPDSVVIGHSLGGTLLADLAATRQFGKMILVSPAPTPIETLLADHLLVVTGGMDAPRVNAVAPSFVEAARPNGELWHFADATHSTTVFDPLKLRMIIEWAGGRGESLRVMDRFAWLGVMVLAGVMAPLVLLGRRKQATQTTDRPNADVDVVQDLAWRLVAMGATLIVLWLVSPLEWLNLFATDYLLGFLFVTGLFLWRGQGFSMTVPGAAIAVVGAVYVISVFAVVIGSQLIHLIPSDVQWFRIPIIAAIGFPLFLFDERRLRPIVPFWKRSFVMLLSRILLSAAIIIGVLLLSTGSSFLVLVMQFFLGFWLVLWWMTGIVRRATGEPGAAALFAALVQGWAFAATFVTI